MSDRLVVVGIAAVAESGKDEVAKILCHEHGFFRVALADAVRSSIRDLDGPTWWLTKAIEKAGRTLRWALQRLGGDAREKAADLAATNGLGSDVEEAINRAWAYVVAFKVRFLLDDVPGSPRRFAIPDVSYHHEIDALGEIVRAMGGTYQTWRVERDGAGLAGEAATHGSEVGRATIPADVFIKNNGTLADLSRIISNAVRDVL